MPETDPRAIPQMVTLSECTFPLVEGDVNGYKTLLLPRELRRHFAEGAHAVRILSLPLARRIPDFEGRTSGGFSLLPHQDNFGNTRDRRRFLTLTKKNLGSRGAATLLMLPSTARLALAVEEALWGDPEFRRIAGTERAYDPRFEISPEQYDRCFDAEEGYRETVREILPEGASPERELSIRLNVLGYLLRGPLADTAMREVRERCGGLILEERWEQAGLLIVDNARAFHARDGGSDPLQRNFCE